MKKLLIPILLSVFNLAFSQENATIIGVIRTSDGHQAMFATIVVKGTNQGTATNSKGEFEINLAFGHHTLVISSVGYRTLEKQIDVNKGQQMQLPAIVLHEDTRQLNEVVISDEKANQFKENQSDFAAKIPLENLENSQVYSSITKDLLKQQLIFSVDDAVKNAPGLQKMWDATGRGGDGGAYYNSRGFILQSQLRNGIAGNVTSKIDAANIEKIEVIKGPSATLFGSTLTSYGGLINRVTKKPYENFGGEISYSTGSFGFNRVSADINTPLNKTKGVYLRMNTAYQYEGSWQDNGFEKGYVIGPALTYQVNEKLSLSFDAELYGSENTSKQIIFFYFPTSQLGASNARDLGIDYNRSYSSNDISQISRSSNYFMQAKYKISDRLTSQTSFTSTHSFSDGPYAYFYLIPNAVVLGDETATGADYLARADQSTANSEITVKEIQQNFIGDFNIGQFRNRFVFGLNLFTQNSNQLFYGTDFDVIKKNGVIENYEDFNRDKLDSALQNGSPWQWPYRYKTSTLSAYVSDVINITDNLMASAALRVDHFENKGNYDQASGEFTGDYSQTALSPKFGLVYQPILKTLAFFANYQNGFTNKNGTDFEGKTFKPEQANQLEGGVKLEALQGKISSTISYYDITVRDLIRPYPQNPNFSIQDGSQVSKGVEVELIANPFQGLNVVTGFSYNHSEFEKSEDDVLGRRPATAMSPYAANLWLSYQFQDGKRKGLGAGFGGNYASDNKILNSETYGEFILPAYAVLNATVFYDHSKFRVGVKADNITDKQYWIGYTTMNPQKPRSFTASLSLKF